MAGADGPLLAGGVGTLPLALLTDDAHRDLTGAFETFRERLRQSPVPDQVKEGILEASYVLLGLRCEPQAVQELYQGVAMLLEDSTTYQQLVNRGRQDTILEQGEARFGKPAEETVTAIRAVDDRERLSRMGKRLLEANS